MPRILFVSGFHPQTRAKDLAHEFEQYVFLLLVSFSAHSFLVLARSSAATSLLQGSAVQLQIRKSLLQAVFCTCQSNFSNPFRRSY